MLSHATKAFNGIKIYLHSIFTWALNGGWVFCVTLRLIYRRE
jgi:hypothetical protein